MLCMYHVRGKPLCLHARMEMKAMDVHGNTTRIHTPLTYAILVYVHKDERHVHVMLCLLICGGRDTINWLTVIESLTRHLSSTSDLNLER